MTSHREIEHKYDPPSGADLPDLTRLAGVESVEPGAEHELEATYFDTAALDLYAHRVTLRRRRGGGDEGWHLKLPAGDDARDEIRLPLSRARHLPPKALRDLVLALTRGAALAPVATIRTRRSESALRGTDAVLAEVSDDRVDAQRTLPGDEPRLLSWREWELELVDAEPSLLAAADDLMADAGVEVSAIGTKLGRALGDAVPAGPAGKRPRPRKPAARVLHTYVAAQVEQVLASDRAVRRREPDGIHDLRVALRRLRTTLATYRPLVDREITDPLRDEMRQVSHTLGSARDTEVVHERLRHLIADEPKELVLGQTRSVLAQAARADAREARRVTDETLRSDRYLGVVDALHRLVGDPPWTDEAQRKAKKVLPKLIAKDLRRVRKRIRAAEDATDPAERTRLMHEVRKSSKRLRYACEAAGPVLGSDAAALETAAKQVQTVLGDHHDTVMTRARLLALAGDATSGDTFTLGRLHAREDTEAARLDRAFVKASTTLDPS